MVYIGNKKDAAKRLFFILNIPILLHLSLDALDAYSFQQVESILGAIVIEIYHSLDTRLDDELRALDAGGCGDVERSSVAVVRTLCNLCDGVCLGVQNIRLCLACYLILADILKARWRAVVAIRDNHLILDYERTHLTTHAV